jgi:hypothetical protein
MTGPSTSGGGRDAHEKSLSGWTKIQTTNLTVQVPRNSDRKGVIYLIGRVYLISLKQLLKTNHPPSTTPKMNF